VSKHYPAQPVSVMKLIDQLKKSAWAQKQQSLVIEKMIPQFKF